MTLRKIDENMIDPNFVQKVDDSIAQLAETATKTEVQVVSTNVSNIIAHNGDGTKDSEVVALRTNSEGTTFIAAHDRVNAFEQDVANRIAEPPALNVVPTISDTLDLESGVYTKNVGEVSISGTMYAGILTEASNYDYIYTNVIAGAKLPPASTPSGMTEYKDKNGNVLQETANSNLPGGVGKYTFTNTGRLWIYVTKGAFATIADARTALGETNLKFELATPVTSVEGVGEITKELLRLRTNKTGEVFTTADKRVEAIEESIEDFTRYLTPAWIQPPVLESVPVASDTYTDFTLTRRVAETTISGTKIAGLITSNVNNDYVFTEVIVGSKFGTGGIVGQTILTDKNGVVLTEGDNIDKSSNVGKYAQVSNGRLWIYVPKATYASVADARTALGTMTLKYQLATPVISTVESGFILDVTNKRDFQLEITQAEPVPINFSNVPTDAGIILTVSLNLKYSENATVTFPSGVLWKGGKFPAFMIGKTYLLFFVSYDAGETWLATMSGEW